MFTELMASGSGGENKIVEQTNTSASGVTQTVTISGINHINLVNVLLNSPSGGIDAYGVAIYDETNDSYTYKSSYPGYFNITNVDGNKVTYRQDWGFTTTNIIYAVGN